MMDYPFLPLFLDKYAKSNPKHRFLIGIIGIPASGKSYLSEKLALTVNEQLGENIATYFNMDGYHYSNEILQKKGIYPYKGAHFTFDVQSFIEKLMDLKEKEAEVLCPIYNRNIHNPVPNAHLIKRTHRIIFVEGNYLLSTIYPWVVIKQLLDFSVFIEVDKEVQYQRLITRHTQGGKSPKEAKDKIIRVDLPNSDLILFDKGRADYFFTSVQNKSIL